MKINTIYDCAKPTLLEQMFIATIKGVLFDYIQSRPEKKDTDTFEYTENFEIVFKHTDEASFGEKMKTIKVIPLDGSPATTPAGLFSDVKKMMEQVYFGFPIYGGFYPKDGETSFVFKTIEISHQTFSGWVAK
jgi:hypothetical protein